MKTVRDFSLAQYQSLLKTITFAGFNVRTMHQFVGIESVYPSITLRHDVDSWPSNALQMAKIEADFGCQSTYYFRVSPLSFDEKVIKQIINLGHEIGYHYEDLASYNGNFEKAIKSFEKNLEMFRKYYPVKTVAMHGRPLSKWNNLDLWNKYDFKDFGIIAEPYKSLDFDKVLYLTDNGNCWDGNIYSVRDEVQSHYKFPIHNTQDLIEHFQNKLLPEQIMLNIHPSRWNENLAKWIVRYYLLTLPKYQAKKWLKQWRNR
jgi:hypothetical protein